MTQILCKDINEMLEKNGNGSWNFLFSIMLENLTYDQINHEHVILYTYNFPKYYI